MKKLLFLLFLFIFVSSAFCQSGWFDNYFGVNNSIVRINIVTGDTAYFKVIYVTVLDTSSADSASLIRSYTNNGILFFKVDGNDSTIYFQKTITGSSVWRDTNSFNGSAISDTVTVVSASINDFYFITARGQSIGSDETLIVETISTGFIVRRNTGTTANLKYNWMRFK